MGNTSPLGYISAGVKVYSLMWSEVVVVPYEAPVLLEQVRLHFVDFMEGFNLATSGRPANAGSYMFNAQFAAMQVKH